MGVYRYKAQIRGQGRKLFLRTQKRFATLTPNSPR
jgi:hypothetical protein